MRKNLNSTGRACSGALFSGLLIVSALLSANISFLKPASAKNQEFPQKIDIIILDEQQEKKNPVTLDLESEKQRPEYKVNVREISGSDLAASEKYLSTEGDIRLSVDRFKGTPAAIFPIEVPPGTNGMTPELAIEIGNQVIASGNKSGVLIKGVDALRGCKVAGADFCLGNQPLIAIKGAKQGTLYSVAINPRMIIRKTDIGYSLGSGNGITQSYESLTPQTAKSGPWLLSETVDWYGNFIRYFHDPKTGKLTDIFYGQRDALPENLRSLHIVYDEKSPVRPTQISAMLGTQQLHSYVMHATDEGWVNGLRECVFSSSEKLVCRPEMTFSWEIEEKSRMPRLASTGNGYGGTAKIEYQEISGQSVVSKITVSDGKQVAESTTYQFKDPIRIDNKPAGFKISVAVDAATGAGDIVTFGDGPLLGVKLKEGSFIGTAPNPQLETVYNYAPLGNDPAKGYVLKSITNSQFDTKNQPVVSNTEERTYDARGRITSVSGKLGQTKITYLDETVPDVKGDAANLVIRRSYKNLSSDSTHSMEWRYALAEGVPSKTSIKAFIDGKEQSALAQDLEVDDYGNGVQMRNDGRRTQISYDQKYRSFPEKVTAESPDGNSYVTGINYDPATGAELATISDDGTSTRRTLDPFGHVIEETTTSKNPMDAAQSLKGEAVLNEKRSWSEGDNGERLLTVTTTTSNTVGKESSQTVIKTLFDSLNRPLRIDSEKTIAVSDEKHVSSLVNEYRLDGRTIRVTDETGMIQETIFDNLGRLVKETTPAYGTYSISYDDAGNIGRIVRNDQPITLQYDDENRLIRKTLPGNRIYQYSYDETLPAKISSVSLPGGQKIDYAYTVSGQLASKSVQIPGPDDKNYKFTTSLTYENTRLKTVTYPDGSEVTYDYSDDFTAKAIRWTKDAPAIWKDMDVSIVTYQASEAEDGDRLLLKKLGNGIQELYSWTETGQLNEISVSKPDSKKDSQSNPILSLEYANYPQSGLLKSSLRKDFRRNGADQFSRSFAYDDDGNLTTVEEKFNDKIGKQAFSYGEHGSLVSDDLARNKYDFENKSTAQLKTSSNGLKFEYDANRNIQTIISANESSAFDFDAEDRLLSASVTRGGRKTETTFVYDHLGERLVKAVKGGAITTYIDPFFEFTLLADGSLQQTRYVWDAMGRVAAFTETVSKDRFLAGLATVPSKQSATGKELSEPSGIPEVDTAFEKAAAALTASMSPSLQAVAPLAVIFFATLFILMSFEKLSRLHRGGQFGNQFMLSTGEAVHPRLLGPVSRLISALVIVSFLGTLIAPSAMAALEAGDGTPKPDQVTFFHHDIRGSVLAVTDEGGNQTAAVSYQPYGAIDESKLTNGNNNFRYKFARMEYDETTGLYYDHARYYHPEIKRFLSTDLARQTDDPYSYTSGDPINYTDPNGRMRQKLLLDDSSGSDNENIGMTTIALDQRETIDDNASNLSMMAQLAGQTINPQYGTLAQPEKVEDSLDWVRYPTFFRMTYGVKKGHVAPESVAQSSDQPTDEEIQAFNKQARSGFMQGWTRTGGYIQSIFSALLLAWWFPTSYSYANGGGTVHAGFWTDLGIYAMTVTAFSGYGKAYTANASAYWNNFMRKGATWKDYLKLSLRRVVHKAVVQVIAFSGITLFGRYARGYPVFDPDWNPASEIKWLVYRNLIFSTFGSVLMLSYYLPTKPPSPTYDDELSANNYQNAKWDEVNNAWFMKRWYLKAAHMYRMFNGRKGFWAQEHPESKIRNLVRNSWYAWYVTQMYVWYVIGSAAYYTGLATLLGTHPSLTKSDFLLSWRGNLAQVILSPAASPFAYINFWHRKSFTIVKKRSVKAPRTPKGSWLDWFWFKILGPVDGLRIAKFDDAAFMPKDDWLGEMRRLKELENVQSGDNDPITSNTNRNSPNQKGSYDEIDSDSNEEQKEHSPNVPGGNESSQSNNSGNVE